jgi:1-deoxy-D-xylulose-5-phosphate synthase
MGPYELRDGKLVRGRGGRRTFSEAFAAALEARMAVDRRVVAVTPAMVEGSALVSLRSRFPDRVFDVGIAEQHAVTFSAGLAAAGARPVVCLYSTFLQRSVDALIHDVALPGLPVVIAIDRAGLVGADGATHQGALDLVFLRTLPDVALASPAGEEDVGALLAAALALERPCALRFPRATLRGLPAGASAVPVEGARWLKKATGGELTLISLGPLALAALEAAEGKPGWGVLDVRWLNPLDTAALLEAARSEALVTVEEGVVRGGLGSAVLELLAREGLCRPVELLGLSTPFIRHGDAQVQRAQLGLDAAGIRRAGAALLARCRA